MSGSLTFSGNEITDATRAIGTSGDGATAPAGVGIWPAATNNVTNGNFTTNTTGWTLTDADSSTTWTRDTGSNGKFGTTSSKFVNTAAGADDYIAFVVSGLTIGVTYTVSAWVNCPVFTSAAILNRGILIIDGVSNTTTTLTAATSGPTRLTATYTATTTLSYIRLYAPKGTTYWGGVQHEIGAFATPYIQTDGATATRAIAAVTAPSSLVTGTQGWWAARVKVGWSSASTSNYRAAAWLDAGNTQGYTLIWIAAGQWVMRRRLSSTNVDATYGTVAFSTGDTLTLVGKWGGGAVGISVNGGAFVTAAASAADPGVSTFAIGGNNLSSGAPAVAGSMLWFACGTGTLTDTDAATITTQAAAGTLLYPEDVDGVTGGRATTKAVCAMVTSTYQNEKFWILDPDTTGLSKGLLPRLRAELDVTTLPTTSSRTWTDITNYIRTLNYRGGGRNDELQRNQPGTLTAQLNNRTSYFDPTNTGGIGIKRSQWVRVRARWLTVEYDRWCGVIEDIHQQWPNAGKDAICTITCADAMKVVNLYDLVGATYSSELTSVRVATVATTVGLTSVIADTGISTLAAVTTPLSDNTLASTYLSEIEQTENGQIYATAAGKIRFESRHYRLLNCATSAGTIGDSTSEIPYREIEVNTDDAVVFNRVTVTPTNADGTAGTAQVATDSTSQGLYFVRPLDRTVRVSSTSEALSCAQYLIGRYKDPSPRVPMIEVLGRRYVAGWPAILAAINGTRFTVKRRGSNTISQDCHVEQIQETIDRPGGEWRTAYLLSPAIDETGWVVESSVLGVLGTTTVATY
ncbi:hypothetical protein UFOVP1186_17 [uncultured Caudovirales phage]|uniref:Uncharacterized protein n=1 Tax=uncultured Caudovirales phage TaxID=2100421 RepID=A0A6J5R5N0_9CAUD|nr:hypothetical protein UFOVP959_7 [uncultured Caudovirales phage]CAB4189314.1 hypothetical protein UFOVP1186_17 [uncultured Caudovirales phage]CAB4192123.1 hypothetical protein UFOVP1234_2 [uncultured Caudovirales phage]CAB4215430.1 hypothetical protein UFOVP1487_15 [uncultured Caudovirales phage]CAB5238947.1 hypothetical protein UFOVP1574_39 [uncultured Caudovirales phage]